jgi:hypothetical protein
MRRRHWWIRQLRRWHRWLGISVVLWLLLLTITGELINHAEAFDLSHTQWSTSWLTNWYGVHAETPNEGFLADTHWLAGNGETWLLDGKKLAVKGEQPLGLVRVGGMLAAASKRRIRFYTVDGQLVDEVEAASLPLPEVRRIGISADFVVVAADRALRSRDGTDWQPAVREAVWSAPRPIPEALRSAWAAQFRATISAERVLIDVHSGRILGRRGPWLLDAVSVVLLALALTGGWLFFRRH